MFKEKLENEVCLYCGLPRSIYDLKIEPGISNPDYKMLRSCWRGHCWITEPNTKRSKD